MPDLTTCLVLWIGFGAACGLIARTKNLPVFQWTVRGLALGVFALFKLMMTPGE